jgi:hypothetical protein
MTDWPRCIANITPDTRCPRRATVPGGLYRCHVHQMPRAVLDLYATETTRRWLAHAAWETMDEGQQLIDEWCHQQRRTA